MTSTPRSMAIAFLAIILLGFAAGNPGHAAERNAKPDPSAGGGSGRGWALGLGVVSSPRPYVGADNALFPVPLVQYHRGGFFVEGIRVGYRWGGRGHGDSSCTGRPSSPASIRTTVRSFPGWRSGGHRSMAKGIIPLKAFREVYGSATREQIRSTLHDAFVRAIRREDV